MNTYGDYMNKAIQVINQEIEYLTKFIEMANAAIEKANDNEPHKLIQLQMEIVALNVQLNSLNRLKANLLKDK